MNVSNLYFTSYYVRVQRNKNKELELRCIDTEKRCQEERIAREASDAKVQILMRQIQEMRASDPNTHAI